ncbi:TetR family transcriptional regulator [Nocardiopsis sp. EMB25]|uniref:TetR/AcrR family transcriptional regulator n=1 Tax=Nocardiopsis sp. EMB25 TaxID=2835867 RepID=UPI002283B47C|nr:TetR family transcriptional regulator [Nocardiopsis sp. EMB25]MCY9783375.1 TetR family transcriptional regulator [Nocardiopsis sp. EMB25]
MSESQRREQILDAVERLLGREGLHAVTMRAVAAEAGVSLRLVQYYGESKERLLTAALERLADRSLQRWRARTAVRGEGAAVAAVRAFFDEALPTDEDGRAFHRVGVCLELLAITRPDTATTAYRDHLRALADHLAGIIGADERVDAARAGRIATEVMALAHGLGSLLMAGGVTQEHAEGVVGDYVAGLQARWSE